MAAERAGDLLDRVRKDLGGGQDRDQQRSARRPLRLPGGQTAWTLLGKVTEEEGCYSGTRCEHRAAKIIHTIDGQAGCLDRTLAEIGVPAWDVLAGRTGSEQRFYEFSGDRESVLGEELYQG